MQSAGYIPPRNQKAAFASGSVCQKNLAHQPLVQVLNFWFLISPSMIIPPPSFCQGPAPLNPQRKNRPVWTVFHSTIRPHLNNIFSRDTGQFRLEQGTTTKMYVNTSRRSRRSASQKLAVSRRVFVIFPLRFVAPSSERITHTFLCAPYGAEK